MRGVITVCSGAPAATAGGDERSPLRDVVRFLFFFFVFLCFLFWLVEPRCLNPRPLVVLLHFAWMTSCASGA